MKACLLVAFCLCSFNFTANADPKLDSLITLYEHAHLALDSFSRYFIETHHIISESDRARYIDYITSHQKDLSSSGLIEINNFLLKNSRDLDPTEQWTHVIKELKKRTPIDTVTLAYAVNSLGEFYAKHNNKNKAIASFLEVIALFPPTSLEEELGYSNGNLGNLLNKQSDPGSSLPYLARALEIFSHHYGEDNLYVSVIQNTLGMTYGRLGNTHKQLDFLLSSKRIREGKLDPCHHMLFEVNNNLALTYSSLREHDKAEAYMNAVLICTRNASPINKSQLVHILSELTGIKSRNTSKYSSEEINQLYHLAIQESESILAPHHPQLINLYNNFAVRSLDLGNNKQALLYFQKALLSAYRPLSERNSTEFFLPSFDSLEGPGVEDATLISNIGGVLQAVYKEDQNKVCLDQAHRAFLLADSILVTLKSNIIHGSSRESIKLLSRRVYTLASTTEAHLYLETLDPKHLETLFQYTEKIKNWELLERFSYSTRSQTLANSELANKIDSLKNQLSFLSNEHSSDSLKSIQNNLLQQLKVQYPFYYEQLYSDRNISLKALQQYCDRNNINWLQYFNVSGGSTGYIFMSADTIVLHLGEGNYENILLYKSQLLESIENKNWAFVSPAHQLYSELIKPVKSFINQEQLVVSGLINIMGVPFDLLLQEDCTPLVMDTSDLMLPYLFNKYTISYMHSAAFALAIENKPSMTQSPAFFAPHYSDEGQHLAWSQAEVDLARAHVGGRIYSATEASEQRLQSTLAKHDLIHFAGHVYADENVDQTYLLMHNSQDSLFLHEIASSRASANLIVLSGCKSAVGKSNPEAVISPAYGFTFAGTPNIISTLWSIEDQSSSIIFDYFYSYLASGHGSIESLTLAKRKFIGNAPKPSRHPFFWAPFVYHGKNVYYDSCDFTWYYIVGGVLLLLMTILFIKYLYPNMRSIQ